LFHGGIPDDLFLFFSRPENGSFFANCQHARVSHPMIAQQKI